MVIWLYVALRGVLILVNFLYMSRLTKYISDTKAELKHVSWPTGKQAVTATALVVLISILVALFTGALDFIFTEALTLFIR